MDEFESRNWPLEVESGDRFFWQARTASTVSTIEVKSPTGKRLSASKTVCNYDYVFQLSSSFKVVKSATVIAKSGECEK